MYMLKNKNSEHDIKDTISQSNETGIPNTLKQQFEAVSTLSLQDVRVHYNSNKPAQFKALAYTQGTNIFISSGEERHLPHELGHVIQQKLRIIPSTGKMNNENINDDISLENNADLIARYAKSNKSMDRTFLSDISSHPTISPIQRKIDKIGIEIECAGVEITGHDDKRIGKETKLEKGEKYTLEADTDNLELVTEPFDITTPSGYDEFLANLKSGLNLLEIIISRTYSTINQPCINYRYRSSKRDETLKYLATPQITMQISKDDDGLYNFTSNLWSNDLSYNNAISSTKQVTKDLKQLIYTQNDFQKINAGFEIINQNATNPTVIGLAMMVWQMYITSLLPSKYFKARFSIIPRTSLKSMYNSMTEAEQTEFKNTATLLQSQTEITNIICNYAYDKNNTNSNEQSTCTLKDVLDSIITDPGTDKFSDPDFNGGGDIGGSIGALDLPSDSSGIFEYRRMPGVSIENHSMVIEAFETVIKHFDSNWPHWIPKKK